MIKSVQTIIKLFLLLLSFFYILKILYTFETTK